MSPTAILSTLRAAFEAVPLIARELQNLRDAIETARNDSAQRELDEIKASLNQLTNQLRTTRDKDEMARIIRSLNKL